MLGQSIGEGQTLVSANKIYELGFFIPAGSTKRYLGIWYHQLPVQTIVWVANRERPVSDSSGIFTIDAQGSLLIRDSKGTVLVLSSSTNTKGSNQTMAKLMDSGNFVLKPTNYSEDFLWQSFDHPTDTFLPGMVLGGQNQVITSWRSSDDPAAGDFSLGLGPNGTHQFLIRQRGQVTNSQNFSTVLEMAAYFYNFSYVPLWALDNYSYSVRDRFTISRGIMDISGQFKQLTWFQDRREWVAYWAEPKKFPCEVPSYCGFNGLCTNDSSSPPCKCLFGFQPSSDIQWRSNNWSGGCVRQAQLLCGKGDGFQKLTSTKLPIFQNGIQNSSLSLDDCRAMCVKNCNCTAYASGNGNGTGCLLWFRELLGLQENYDGGQDLYYRLVASELNGISDHKKKRSVLVTILSVAGSIVVLLPCIAILYLNCGKALALLSKIRKKLTSPELSSNPGLPKLFGDAMMHGEGNKGFGDAMMHGEGNKGCPLVSFAKIKAATENFCDSNKLGEGGFGPVYKGMLDGQTIAVKRLAKNSGQGIREFKNEITLIANLQHRNLVRLLGCCIEEEEKILIYEYLPNKSLDTYIFDTIRGAELDWQKRFHTIEGIAQGLLYLHKFSRLKAWELWTEGRSLEFVDPILGDLFPPQEVSRCIHVALLCVQDHAADRPTISAVISMLHNETSLPFPKQPAFYVVRDEGSSSVKQEICSINNASFTSTHGR
ncbi:hypothetical protein J5N97_011788 [Dioscorea zingiberensis]|uniref:Receptor-like serine/threonine-protein kinase n=1 Tax=Dioscorea zingiberensis TaxID=325984 RepID=A0A9D5D1R4_9LILI|nr:hypothetical protein J5N97_011788 [Dioscorea zingiberensis]